MMNSILSTSVHHQFIPLPIFGSWHLSYVVLSLWDQNFATSSRDKRALAPVTSALLRVRGLRPPPSWGKGHWGTKHSTPLVTWSDGQHLRWIWGSWVQQPGRLSAWAQQRPFAKAGVAERGSVEKELCIPHKVAVNVAVWICMSRSKPTCGILKWSPPHSSHRECNQLKNLAIPFLLSWGFPGSPSGLKPIHASCRMSLCQPWSRQQLLSWNHSGVS